jgi:hypothetical protein
MQVQFKYPRIIEGKLYAKGIHEVPDAAAADWFFKACVNDGACSISEPAPVEKPKQGVAKPASQSQRSKG